MGMLSFANYSDRPVRRELRSPDCKRRSGDIDPFEARYAKFADRGGRKHREQRRRQLSKSSRRHG